MINGQWGVDVNIGLISLGCAKNLVDSEMVLGMFKHSGFTIVNRPEEADVLVVNTCGFIDASKKESIETIIDMGKYGKKLVVIGCLVERYIDELKKLLPEVDLFVPLREYSILHAKLKELLQEVDEKVPEIVELNPFQRLLSTPKYSAYLRISDGCSNNCTYCAIPLIRGQFKSRPFEDVVKEAKDLASRGIKELVVISQDTTHYGSDLAKKTTITELLRELLKIKEYQYIRLLYLYPDEVRDDLIELIGKEPRLTPYFDLPIQHASSKVLAKMNRRGDEAFLRGLIERIRAQVPNAIIRTTLIVGFPGETEEDFNKLLTFVQDVKFDHLGAFTYSKEEGTAAFRMKNQVPEVVKKERLERLMQAQRHISYQRNKAHIGEIMTGIVTEYDKKHNQYLLRSYWNAPDDIDGKITFKSDRILREGQIVNVKITSAFIYDLDGEHVILD